MSFHFTSEAVDDQLYTDFTNLSKFPEDVRDYSQRVPISVTLCFISFSAVRATGNDCLRFPDRTTAGTTIQEP